MRNKVEKSIYKCPSAAYMDIPDRLMYSILAYSNLISNRRQILLFLIYVLLLLYPPYNENIYSKFLDIKKDF